MNPACASALGWVHLTDAITTTLQCASSTMSAAVTEVYRSSSRSDCDERAFVLAAVGIASVIGHDGFDFFLQVEVADGFRALEQLRDYAAESRPTPVPPAPPVLYPNAWIGCVVYAAVLLGVALHDRQRTGRSGCFSTPGNSMPRVQAGQWWRAWTALTLHLDAAHLVGNLGAGCWFVYLAARRSAAAMPGSWPSPARRWPTCSRGAVRPIDAPGGRRLHGGVHGPRSAGRPFVANTLPPLPTMGHTLGSSGGRRSTARLARLGGRGYRFGGPRAWISNRSSAGCDRGIAGM